MVVEAFIQDNPGFVHIEKVTGRIVHCKIQNALEHDL